MLKTRILTAIVLLGLFLPALFWLPLLAWAAIMLGLMLVCLSEWAGFLQLSKSQRHVYLVVSALLGLTMLFLLPQQGFHWFFYHALQVFALATAFWLVVVPVALFFHVFSKNKGINAIVGWGLMMSLWLALVAAKEVNPYVLLVIISTIWLADSAAYFAGKQFGRHKLAPAISPGKTWEGVFGALFAVAIYAAVLKIFGAVSTWWILPGLWVVTIAGVYGDLFESFFKRRANLKDSGQFLPGHGGLLDRVDGVIPALPIGMCLLFWFHYWQQSYSF
ncbi:phosphatidate cytidylyltransferase [Methylophilus sp. TWE2]|uniref:phosphatidate cytidylyltransferase n=1 Tax=Methylophilus sp. TWE2 TaxID=1662285 RepID=UPI0006709059|nr:phosphatidate cytidylyltransferase [Methylophilus sp. TWE2]AKR42998.1 phosphatidate cytidylyltransferase [Methylophilus sp. TWE2]